LHKILKHFWLIKLINLALTNFHDHSELTANLITSLRWLIKLINLALTNFHDHSELTANLITSESFAIPQNPRWMRSRAHLSLTQLVMWFPMIRKMP